MAEIWAYTHGQWGRDQADLYAAKLRTVAHALLVNPNGGRPVNFSSTIRRIRAEHHFLYFRTSDEEVLVLRFLHERMDPPRHVRDLA